MKAYEMNWKKLGEPFDWTEGKGKMVKKKYGLVCKLGGSKLVFIPNKPKTQTNKNRHTPNPPTPYSKKKKGVLLKRDILSDKGHRNTRVVLILTLSKRE